MKIINCTPHPLTFVVDGQENTIIPPSGVCPRLASVEKQVDEVAGIPVYDVEFGDIDSLPEPVEGVVYVVSALVKGQANRPDLYSPAQLVRDDEGNVIGAKGLSR